MPVTVSKQKNVWNKVLVEIEKSLKNDSHNYLLFYADLKLVEMTDDTMKIVAPSVLVKAYLSNPDHSQLLNEVVTFVTNKEYKLSFYLSDEIEVNETSSTNVVSSTPVQNDKTFFNNCKLNTKYTFDNFVVGECNKEAVTASVMISKDPGKYFNPLFIYSKSGLGKTHLLHAIGNYFKEKNPSSRVLYITTDAFIDEFVKYVHGGQDNQSLKEFFNTVDLLLVDDIQFLSNKTKTAEMFFYIFYINMIMSFI